MYMETHVHSTLALRKQKELKSTVTQTNVYIYIYIYSKGHLDTCMCKVLLPCKHRNGNSKLKFFN